MILTKPLFIGILALILCSNAVLSDSGDMIMIPENEGKISKEALDNAHNYSSSTNAMRYLASICIKNRKNYRGAKRALLANGYLHLANFKSGGEYWVSPKPAPLITLERDHNQIGRCEVLIGTPTRKVGDLSNLLDELTVEDIQTIDPDIINARIGEQGWVLRPGFEYAVYLMESTGDQAALVLSKLN